VLLERSKKKDMNNETESKDAKVQINLVIRHHFYSWLCISALSVLSVKEVLNPMQRMFLTHDENRSSS
jgi:hypothetical protein